MVRRSRMSALRREPSAAERIRRLADELHALYVDPDFAAVGQYYDIFPQTTDDEVLRALTSEV